MTRSHDLSSPTLWYAKQPRLAAFPTVASVQDFFLQPEQILGSCWFPLYSVDRFLESAVSMLRQGQFFEIDRSG